MTFRSESWSRSAAAGEIDDGGFPWKLIPADDAPLAGEWSFCEFDPLWGLEKPDLTQPESPYIGLRPFTHQEAGVFFGRRAEIRELYDAVMTPGGSPLLFYYGQSGVGKSSVLDAGLVPWLSPYRTVRYVRRDPNLGLLGTLRHELSTAAEKGAMDHTTDILQLWQDAAARPPGRPMVVILDQAEEVFTKPFHAEAASPSTYSKDSSQAELAAFFAALRPLLNEPGVKPRDRLLILGFRKEWQPEFSRIAREAGLTPGEVFLKPLGRAGIIEAIEGPSREMRRPRSRRPEIPDAGLADDIARDILRFVSDPEKNRFYPLAPALQNLLAWMWDEAKKRNNEEPVFDRKLWIDAQNEGYGLDRYLDRGLSGDEKLARRGCEIGPRARPA